MNRRKKKLIYVRIKNSWRQELGFWNYEKIIKIMLSYPPPKKGHNPKHPLNEIIMDFRNRDEIVKYGVMKSR